MDNPNIRPSRIYYGFAVFLFFIIECTFAVYLFKSINSFSGLLKQIEAPGQTTLRLEEAGDYTVFYEHRSTYKNKMYNTPDQLHGLILEVKNASTDVSIPLTHASMNSNYSFGSRSGVSVFDFTIEQPGDYTFQSKYEDQVNGPDIILAISSGFMLKLMFMIFSAIAISFSGVLIAGVIIIVVFIKRRNYRMAMEDYPGN